MAFAKGFAAARGGFDHAVKHVTSGEVIPEAIAFGIPIAAAAAVTGTGVGGTTIAERAVPAMMMGATSGAVTSVTLSYWRGVQNSLTGTVRARGSIGS